MSEFLIIVGAILAVFALSLGVNLIMTPIVNWAIHLFNNGITLSYWQVYGLSFVLSLITGGTRVRSNN